MKIKKIELSAMDTSSQRRQLQIDIYRYIGISIYILLYNELSEKVQSQRLWPDKEVKQSEDMRVSRK